MVEQGLLALEELERQIDSLPTHVLGKSTESVTRPLRAFVDLRKKLSWPRRQGTEPPILDHDGLLACLLWLFPEQQNLVNSFYNLTANDNDGVTLEIDNYSLVKYINLALKGDERAKGTLYAIMLSQFQDPTEFQEMTGFAFLGGLGGNCANFASIFLHFGMDFPTWTGGETDLYEWFFEGEPDNWGGNDTWRSVKPLFDFLKQRGWYGDSSVVAWYGDAIAMGDIFQPGGTLQNHPIQRNDTLEYGDLVFYEDQHVAVIIGYGLKSGEGPFFPTYAEAVRAIAGTEFDLGTDTDSESIEVLAERLAGKGMYIVPWQVDHSGTSEKPRPVGSEAGNPIYVHMPY